LNRPSQFRSPIQDPAIAKPDIPARRTAAEILLADDTLRTAYLLNNPRSSDPAALTDDRAARFLLWFAVEGRKHYQHVVFSPAYLAFLATPVPPYGSRLAAYLLIDRPDLRKRFGDNPAQYHGWYYNEGVVELGLAPLVSARERLSLSDGTGIAQRYRWLDRPAADHAQLPGVNIIGFGDNVMGIGEDVRALTAALGHAGIPRAIFNISLSDKFGTSAPHEFEALRSDRPIFPINIFALPPFEMARLHIEHGANLFHRRYSIGYWPWELTSIPAHWRGIFDLVGEIWASSEFLLDVFRKLTAKPVQLVPPYLNVPMPTVVDLASSGISADDLVFLTLCDLNSFTTRKNPEGTIVAFKQAFATRGRERLVIKALNAHSQPTALQRLQAMIGDDDRCVVLLDTLSRAEIAGLIQRADCLVSLHRAEGFGRVIAEAMALGTAVVATNWSGNTSYLDETRGYPVSFTLRDVAVGEYVFQHGSQWAEPSIEDAVVKLRLARDHIGHDREMRQRAMDFVSAAYGLDPVALNLAKRIGILAAERPEILG
jgi:glycosyltransferase involved in cell wall biosynthesis